MNIKTIFIGVAILSPFPFGVAVGKWELPVQQSVTPLPALTENQAREKALAFLAKWIKESPLVAQKNNALLSSMDVRYEESGDISRIPLWQFSLEGGWEMSVQKSNGLILAVTNGLIEKERTERNQAVRIDGKMPPVVLSDEKLIAKAKTLQKLFGVSGELVSEPRIQKIEEEDTNYAVFYEWRRQFQNFPYKSQALSICIDGYSGEISTGLLRNWTPSPKNTARNIDEVQASQIAAKAVLATFDVSGKQTKIQRMVVEKNSFWADDGPLRTDGSASYLAWVVTITPPDNPGIWIDVSVDSQTGRLLAGEMKQVRGAAALVRKRR